MQSMSADDEVEIPLVNQRYFGAGLKRKCITFVPSSTSQPPFKSLLESSSQSASAQYLAIVLGKKSEHNGAISTPEVEQKTTADAGDDAPATTTCDICRLKMAADDASSAHESSIVHQICLQHSHPPSHLDRNRRGLAVLESQGWDPDSRRGLGADGEGILHPIKAKKNVERSGIGLDLRKQPAKVEKPVMLDAGKVRQQEEEGKKKAEKLRSAFYRSEDVEKYLGEDGMVNTSLDMAAFKRSKRSR